jgi:hypothetical protein
MVSEDEELEVDSNKKLQEEGILGSIHITHCNKESLSSFRSEQQFLEQHHFLENWKKAFFNLILLPSLMER